MSWTRRLFLREILKGWLGLVILPALYSSARSLIGSRSSGLASPRDVGAVGALELGMSKTVQLGNKRILVTHSRDGQIRAVSATCTHMGCSIRFEADSAAGEIACNCHESKFTLRGENLSGPATRPLTEYSIEAVGGRLILSGASEMPKRR